MRNSINSCPVGRKCNVCLSVMRSWPLPGHPSIITMMMALVMMLILNANIFQP